MFRSFAICVLLLTSVAGATDWDQVGRSYARLSTTDWDQIGVVPVERPVRPAVRTVVYGYVAANEGECPPCDEAKLAVRKAVGLEFDVEWTTKDPGYGKGTPTFFWNVGEDRWMVIEGWWGLDSLRDSVLRTTRPVSGPLKKQRSSVVPAEASPTPQKEVDRVLGLLPRPDIGFADIGCGDGRWLLAAARRWPGCKITGVEIDPARAAAARERVAAEGLSHVVTIVTGDAITTPLDADVVTFYLYPEVIAQLIPKLKSMKACASYIHEPIGLGGAVKNGDSWLYFRDSQGAVVHRRVAVWDGMQYSGRVCSNANCRMCAEIMRQLNNSATATSQQWIPPRRKKTFLGFEWE